MKVTRVICVHEGFARLTQADVLIPVGTIIYHDSSQPLPGHWMETDGRWMGTREFPELYAIVGDRFTSSKPIARFYNRVIRRRFRLPDHTSAY